MIRFASVAAAGTAVAVLLAVAPSPFAQDAATLRPVESFASIEDDRQRGAALFEEMAKVLTHPRCLNCHPRDDTPRQGDAMAVHQPPVTRGVADFGAPGMRCSTCHGTSNATLVGVGGMQSMPGHDPWHLAPREMGWIGLTVRELCEQIKDPARNGDRSLAELQEHNAKDGLVGWGWSPGEGREPAPGTQAQFGALTQAWINAGAPCP